MTYNNIQNGSKTFEIFAKIDNDGYFEPNLKIVYLVCWAFRGAPLDFQGGHGSWGWVKFFFFAAEGGEVFFFNSSDG